MKKFKRIIPIVIAFIIGISTTVGAATVFNSKDITYSSTATTKTNVKDSLDELYTKASKIGQCPEGYECYEKIQFKSSDVGKYVNMTPTSTSYTISKDLTGYTSDQTINPSELNLWRIIKINTDGTVEMVSDKVSSNIVILQAQKGYANMIKVLNTIAKQYTDNKHVLSGRHVGFGGETETITDTSALTSTTPPWKLRECSTWSCTTSNFTSDEEKKGAGGIGYIQDYKLINSVYGTMKASKPDGTYFNYWLASRAYMYNASANWMFEGDYVYRDGTKKTQTIHEYRSGFLDDGIGASVRPIVILKPREGYVGGVGTINNPYILSFK